MSEKQLDIHQLIQLSHIGEVRDIFALKVEELKASKAGKLIEDYRLKKNTHRQLLFESVVQQEKAAKNGHKDKEYKPSYEKEPSLYWFELTRYKPWMWQVTEIEPEPPPHERRLRILPYDIIERMAEAEVNPVKVNQPKPVLSLDSNCFYDLKYVRYSSNTLFGVVRENRQMIDEIYGEINIPPEKKMEIILHLLPMCMSEYPLMTRKFIDDMFDMARPCLAAVKGVIRYMKERIEKKNKDQ